MTHRVLVLVDRYIKPFGGTEGQIRTLVEHLPATWEAEVWALRESPWFARGTFPVKTRVLEIGSLRSPRTLLRLRSIARAIRRAGFDLVHTYMNDASVLGALLARRADVPLLISRRDLGFWQSPQWLSLLRRTNRLADGVLANCEAVAAHTALAEHVPPGRIHVVHNGQPRESFETPAAEHVRTQCDTPPEARVVGFLANVRALKRQDDLLAAFDRIAGDCPDVYLWFVGDDLGVDPPDAPPLAERVRAHDCADRVRVFRAEGNAVAVLKHLEVGVLCSETEGLSNALLEYLGCGLPIVATRVGGNPDLVVHGQNGLLFEPGDVPALAAHLEALLDDPERARAMGAASRRHYETGFTVDRMVAETVRCYDDTLRTPPSGDDLSLDVLEDVDTLEALVPEWEALVGRRRFFLGPDWVLTWARHAPHAARLRVLVARDSGGRLVGLLPLALHPGRVLEFAGQRLGGDHTDILALPERADEVARAMLAHLQTMSWRRLRLRHLSEDSSLRAVLRGHRSRHPFRERQATVCPYLPIEGSYEEYLAGFSKRGRRNLRYYPRRFLATEGAAVERVREPDDVAAAVDRFFHLHARRFREKGERTSVTPELATFHRHLAERTARSGRVALTFLKLGERDVACEYGFVHGETMYSFQSGYDADTPVVSPGQVLRAFVLRDDVFGEGLSEYDFLDGDEAYKRRWTGAERRLFDVEIHRDGFLGRTASTVAGVPRFLREWLHGRGEPADGAQS